METLRRVGSAIASVALTSIAAAGCGADDDPTTAKVAAPTDTDRRGAAIDTVRAWVAGYNDALATGKAAEATALSDGCDTCDELLAAGSGATEGRWRLDRAHIAGESGDTVAVLADVTVAESRARDELLLRFVVDVTDPATIADLTFLQPRAGGAAGSVGGMIGR